MDEFLKLIICIGQDGDLVVIIQEDDVVVFFNFCIDCFCQLMIVFIQEDLLDYGMYILFLYYVMMICYDEIYKGVNVMLYKKDIENILGEVIFKVGLI